MRTLCGHCEHHGHECECRGRGHYRRGRAWEETCGCGHHEGSPFGFHRRFVSRAERIAELEAYLAELQAEAKAVEEYLAGLKASA